MNFAHITFYRAAHMQRTGTARNIMLRVLRMSVNQYRVQIEAP